MTESSHLLLEANDADDHVDARAAPTVRAAAEGQRLRAFIVVNYVDLFLGQSRKAAWGTLAAASLLALTW